MNILQHLKESKHGLVLVTLNPPFEPDPAKVVGRWQYEHPMMTSNSISAQAHLPEIQNTRNISYAGAWTKYGFHEDGFASAMRLVCAPPFDVTPPFPIKPAHRDLPAPGTMEVLARWVILLIQRALVKLSGVLEWIAWVVVLGLVWIEQIVGALGLEGMRDEVQRLRVCWSGEEEGKKRR